MFASCRRSCRFCTHSQIHISFFLPPFQRCCIVFSWDRPKSFAPRADAKLVKENKWVYFWSYCFNCCALCRDHVSSCHATQTLQIVLRVKKRNSWDLWKKQKTNKNETIEKKQRAMWRPSITIPLHASHFICFFFLLPLPLLLLLIFLSFLLLLWFYSRLRLILSIIEPHTPTSLPPFPTMNTQLVPSLIVRTIYICLRVCIFGING